MISNSIQGCFAEQVGRTPDAVATSAAEVRLTYRQLDERSNQLAHRLRDLGVGPGRPAAVLMERSVNLVVALLAIVKTGAHYIPLHEAYPRETTQRVIDSCGRPVLVTDSAMLREGLPETSATIAVDADPGLDDQPRTTPTAVVHPDDAAYVMHTSGSTGQPKGVVVTHRNVLGLITDSCWDTARHERVLMIAPHAFSVSSFELWVPLLRGGHVIVAPPKLEIATLERLIRDERITGLHVTAGLFRVIAQERPECFAGVREVLTGGDVVSPTAVKRVLDACPDLVVRVTYGATETSLFTVNAPITAPYVPDVSVPIGRPMDGVELHILDERLAEVPAGVDGELYVSGRRLARGYLGRADLTAERFVADPFGEPGSRMYRTGDLARWTPDGLVDLLGRADQQVKILGFRVELAEVEATLSTYPGLGQVAVIARELEPGDKRLAAYLVPETGDFDTEGLRAHALESLPEYMVPKAFVVLDELPLTPNGKLDHRGLPVPNYDSAVRYREPTTPTEATLCTMIAEVLDAPRVGIDDSFFELGGQSLLAMRLISRIRSSLGVDLPLTSLFDAPTVASLAKQIENKRA